MLPIAPFIGGFFSDVKNIIITALVVVLIGAGGYAWYQSHRADKIEDALKLSQAEVEALKTEIGGIKGQLATCDANIASIKEHNTRLTQIARRTQQLQSQIDKIKIEGRPADGQVAEDSATIYTIYSDMVNTFNRMHANSK
jgi:uncharacterized protein HemX